MIRPYTKADYGCLEHALLDAGFEHKQMTFETDHTFVTEFGFFSYRKDVGYSHPRMGHFYVNKQDRSFTAALALFHQFKQVLLLNGFLLFIAEAPKELPYMNKVIKFVGGLLLGEVAKDKYYLVPVFKKGRKHENL